MVKKQKKKTVNRELTAEEKEMGKLEKELKQLEKGKANLSGYGFPTPELNTKMKLVLVWEGMPIFINERGELFRLGFKAKNSLGLKQIKVV